MRGRFVRLHIAADFTHVIFKFPPHRPKGVPNRNICIGVSFIFSRTMAHDKFTARNVDKDPDFEDLALPLVAMRKLDRHMATDNSVADMLKAVHMLPNLCLNGG